MSNTDHIAAVRFSVSGMPKGAGSKRPMPGKNGGVYMKDMGDEKGEVWTQLVNSAARAAYQGEPLSGPVHVKASFQFPRPKAHYRTGKMRDELRPGAPQYVDRTPDIDKLTRRLYDAITGVIWIDDKQIAQQTTEKLYGMRPGVVVEILRLNPEPASEDGGA